MLEKASGGPGSEDVPKPLPLVRREMGFEEFDASMVAIGGRTILTGPEEVRFCQHELRLGDVGLQVYREGGANYFEGSNGSRVTICVGLPAAQRITGFGTPMDSNRLAVIRPGAEIYSSSTGVCRYAILDMPVESFEQRVDAINPTVADTLIGDYKICSITTEAWLELVDILNRTIMIASTGTCLSQGAQEALIEDLTSAFVDAVAGEEEEEHPKGRPRKCRRQIVDRVRECLRDPSPRFVPAADLARRAGVSERTLRTVVRQHFGISLKQLVIRRRLHDVRRDLLDAAPGALVSHVAANRGIWDWGRFSRRYKEVFGELPSDTLNRDR